MVIGEACLTARMTSGHQEKRALIKNGNGGRSLCANAIPINWYGDQERIAAFKGGVASHKAVIQIASVP